MRPSIATLVLLCACSGDDPKPDTTGTDADTDTDTDSDTDTDTDTDSDADTDTGSMGDTGDPYANPVLIDIASVTCPAPDTVRFYAMTQGLTGGALVFVQETGNATPQWTEEHGLPSVRSSPVGDWDELQRELPTGVSFGSFVPSVNSLFTCPYHYETNTMSYVFRIYDTTGALADCMAFGHDPAGLLAGTYPRVTDPVRPGELVGCTIP